MRTSTCPANAERRLRERHVDLRDRFLRQAELPDIADDADDGEPLLRGVGVPRAGGAGSAIRLPIGSVPSQYFVIALLMTDDAQRFLGVEIVEDAAADDRHADGREILRRRDADVGSRPAFGIVD